MAVVVYSVNPYRALFDDGGGARFSFNGVDQYATMPPWAANGKPRQYWFNFIADAVATGTEQVIISGVDGGIVLEFYLHATLPTMSIRYRSATGTQAIEQLVGVDIVPGDEYVIHVINLGTGSELYVNTVKIDVIAFEASDGIQPALTHIGAGHEIARFFGGQLWSDRLVDDSPIQDTYANMGDGVRYGQLEQAIVLEGDYDISFDWIRPTNTSSLMTALGDDVAESFLFLYGSTSTSPNNVLFDQGTNSATWVGALEGVAAAQHCKLRIVRTNRSLELLVDDVSKGTTLVYNDSPIHLAEIGAYNGGSIPMQANSAMQNVVIKDLENNLTWNYPLNEGTGTDIINTDPSTPGYNGSWTPDTDWVFIDDNSRFYPMSEGSGDTFKAYNGKGEPAPVNDATIVNYTDNWG